MTHPQSRRRTFGVNSGQCQTCRQRMAVVAGCTKPQYPRAYLWGKEFYWEEEDLEPLDRCPDCACLIGHAHHANCLKAWCSVCQDQAVMCEHDE